MVPAVPCNKSYSMSNLRNPKFLYCNSLGLIPAMKNMHDILDHCRRKFKKSFTAAIQKSLIPAMQNIKENYFIPAMQKIQEFLDSCHAKSARKSISLPCKTCTKFLIPAMQSIQEILDSCHAEHARNSWSLPCKKCTQILIPVVPKVLKSVSNFSIPDLRGGGMLQRVQSVNTLETRCMEPFFMVD